MKSSKFITSDLFLCLALAPLLCDAWHFNTSFYILWCSDDCFTPKSPYEPNLKKLLSTISLNAPIVANNSGYYTTNTSSIDPYNHINSETIYGFSGCRGDINPDACARCITDAISYLPAIECPNDKGVIMWYKACKIRYSNKFFLGVMDEEDMNYTFKNKENISTLTNDVDGFMSKVGDTLHGLAAQFGSLSTISSKFSSTKMTKVSNVLTLYTMSECTRSIIPSDCQKCLAILSNEISTSCYGSKGATALSPSCYTRFEIYPFYNVSTRRTLPSTPFSNGRSTTSLIVAEKHKSKKLLLITVLIGAHFTTVTLLLVVYFGIRICRRKTPIETFDELEAIKTVHSLQFDFNTIKTATSNFSTDNKIGEGGFGEVYKGKLESGQEVAVKRLSKKTGQGVEQFKTEVLLVAKLQHKNLVKLSGFCVASKEKMLVYEFLLNSSLDRFLFDPRKKEILDWQTRFKIIVGIAKGILYLHEDSRLKVVHRDLKTSNILLDEEMNPKISDFGLAKLFEADQTQGDTKKIAGTYGYIAPEYAITGCYSVKSDIYSFGVIILEILSSQRSTFTIGTQQNEPLLSYAWKLRNEGRSLELIDEVLSNNFPKEEALKCIDIGLLCIQDNANERPNMTLVVAALNGQTVEFPVPKPPSFLGSFSNSANDQGQKLDQRESFSKYTGLDTITELFPRE